MAQEERSVPAQHIFLDTENPRHDRIDNEKEIIARLIAHEQVISLAADIADEGLSPLDRLAVIPHSEQKGRYVALEGNRRVCALKLLADPDLAPTKVLRKALLDLKRRARHPVDSIEVVCFDTRGEARHWLDVRHGNAGPGVSTRSWNATQKARFDADARERRNPNALALQLVDHAIERGLVPAGRRPKINLTTLTRFLSNKLVRDALGIASNKELRIDAPIDEFERAAGRFLNDSLAPKEEKSGVHSRTSVGEREAYARRLRTEGVAVSTKLAASQVPPRTPPTPGVPPRRPRDNKSPDKRSRIVPTTFSFRFNDRIQKRIYDELKGIDPAEFSFAATYLLRATIELAAKAYCKRHGLPREGKDLHELLGEAARHLQAGGVDEKVLKPLRVMAGNRDAPYSPETIGHAIHGGAVPTAVELIRHWDTIEMNLLLLLKGAS